MRPTNVLHYGHVDVKHSKTARKGTAFVRKNKNISSFC
jgi:hypothetical protein